MFVNGVHLNIKKTGSGPPILALHGFAGNMSTWDNFVEEARTSYAVITIDLLGHGASDCPVDVERYSPEHTIADIATALRKLRISRPCLLGYSMGGRLALLAAVSHPSMPRCLILEGASPGLESPSARKRRMRRDTFLARMIMEEGVETFSSYWEKRPLFKSQRSLPLSIRKRIREERVRNNPVGLANTLRAANPGAQPPVHKLLPKLKIPVLCIVGEHDYKFKAIATAMCGELPHGRLVVIQGAGHAVHIEKPREFNRAVFDFLREI